MINKELWPAINLVQSNPVARETFELVTNNLGISGYAIAKQLDKNPAVVQDALRSLRATNLINSSSAELHDNFTLTGAGFHLKQFLMDL